MPSSVKRRVIGATVVLVIAAVVVGMAAIAKVGVNDQAPVNAPQLSSMGGKPLLWESDFQLSDRQQLKRNFESGDRRR